MNLLNKILITVTIIFSITLLIVYIIHSQNHDLHIKPNTCNYYCQSNKYNDLELKGLLSDKIKVKEYLKKNHPDIKYAKLLYATKNPDTLKNYSFPDKFVLKNSAGSRMSKVVTSKEDVDQLIKTSEYFMGIKFSNYGYRKIPFFGFEEPHYDYNDPHIMIEEYIPDTQEFRIFMIKGKIIYYEHIFDYSSSKEWYEGDNVENSPEYLKEMKDFCNKIYRETKIDFMRIDFLTTPDDFYFGEITFTPDNCRKKYSQEFENKLQSILIKDLSSVN